MAKIGKMDIKCCSGNIDIPVINMINKQLVNNAQHAVTLAVYSMVDKSNTGLQMNIETSDVLLFKKYNSTVFSVMKNAKNLKFKVRSVKIDGQYVKNYESFELEVKNLNQNPDMTDFKEKNSSICDVSIEEDKYTYSFWVHPEGKPRQLVMKLTSPDGKIQNITHKLPNVIDFSNL